MRASIVVLLGLLWLPACEDEGAEAPSPAPDQGQASPQRFDIFYFPEAGRPPDGGALDAQPRPQDAQPQPQDAQPQPQDAQPQPQDAQPQPQDAQPQPQDARPREDAAPTTPIRIEAPARVEVQEREALTLDLSASEGARLFAFDLPPGARFLPGEDQIRFTPDFTQGGRAYTARILAVAGARQAEQALEIAVIDTIQPPAPRIIERLPGDGFERLLVEQTTDPFLDAPDVAGRTYMAWVMAPTQGADHSVPVRVSLHGFNSEPWQEGWRGELRISPTDPINTYWWGHANAEGTAPPYTQRRVLHLLDWAMRAYPVGDPQRIYLEGGSMGGAGAAGLGLLWARHFAYVIATIGQTVARNHRPSRVEQLSTLWGTPERNRDDGSGMGVWDRQDLTRALRDEHEARQQFLFLKHGKDDPIIHFGAVSHASPITGRSFYEALLAYRPGYFAVWDEGGHGAPPDPRLGEQWWTQGWNPIFDDVARLRRDEAFPAFSASSLDRDWGGGEGDGRISWDDESGFAADVDVSGDTGWRGDIAGALNRFLRWDSTGIIDEIDRFEIPLRLLDGPGAPGVDGWPSTGDLPPSASATVSVTLRRVQRFQVRPGERLAWRLGAQGGEIVAEGGEIFIEGLTLTQGWETLSITR